MLSPSATISRNGEAGAATFRQLPLAVSVGCPAGIGPEVVVRACARWQKPLLLVGDRAQLRALARRLDVSLDAHTIIQPGESLARGDRLPGQPTPASGAAQLGWVDAATDLVTAGKARALVTGPVSKAIIAASGAPGAASFLGHTEHLQRRLGAKEVVMAFWSPRLVTSLVTTHLPLARVARALRPRALTAASYWLAWLLFRLSPKSTPRIVMASFNPHAGEHGLLGHEEETRLRPALVRAQQQVQEAGIPATFVGPMGAETAFRQARDKVFAGVVAMYHDQATIPLKLVSFGDAVNVSLGLPIVRTSVDHGTGYDLAGQDRADPAGLLAAFRLADRLSRDAYRDKNVRGRGRLKKVVLMRTSVFVAA